MSEVKKVLLVDDEPDVIEFLRVALEQEGVTFRGAGDGEEALVKVAEEAPDLIILDVQMPKKDGFMTFQELRRSDTSKNIPVVMLTSVSERTGLPFNARDMGEYFGSEPEAYIDKPIDPEKVLSTVNELLGLG